MKKINLLPHKVQKAKDAKRIAILIAAVQIAVFLTLIVLYAFLSIWGARLEREALSLRRLLGVNPVQQAGIGIRHHVMQEEFLSQEDFINAQVLPSGIRLIEMGFVRGEFRLVAATSDILYIKTHMELIEGHFYDIRLTHLAASGDGYYVYGLVFSAR